MIHKARKVAAEEPEWFPDPLDELETDEAKRLYGDIVKTLAANETENTVTKAIALRVAKNAEAAEDARRLAVAEPVSEGSMGQPVANPSWAILARLEDRILADLKALRITPDSAGYSSQSRPSKQDPDDDFAKLDELDRRRRQKTPAG